MPATYTLATAELESVRKIVDSLTVDGKDLPVSAEVSLRRFVCGLLVVSTIAWVLLVAVFGMSRPAHVTVTISLLVAALALNALALYRLLRRKKPDPPPRSREVSWSEDGLVITDEDSRTFCLWGAFDSCLLDSSFWILSGPATH